MLFSPFSLVPFLKIPPLDNQNNILILAALDLIQGMILLHPHSRKLFAREIHMNVMLDLLDAGNSGAVQCATLLTLVCALIDHPANIRVSPRVFLHSLQTDTHRPRCLRCSMGSPP